MEEDARFHIIKWISWSYSFPVYCTREKVYVLETTETTK